MLDRIRHRTVTDAAASRPAASGSEAGMTLIELVVAITLLAIIMLGLSASIGTAFQAVSLGRQRQVAEAAANKRLEELRDVDYDQMAMSEQPVQSADTTNPDHWVSAGGTTYDVTGKGEYEPLIVDAATPGPVLHVESPVVVGTTKVDVYQFVTWVDAPNVPGTQNLKRITVVVKYRNVTTPGTAHVLRESVLFTNGTVTVPRATAATTTTTTTVPTTTTTVPPSGCGSFAVASGSGSIVGYTGSRTVTLTLAMAPCASRVWTQFSNDGGTTWGAESEWAETNPTLAWTLATGDGTRTIAGRARFEASGYWSLGAQSIVLDTTEPTTPGTLTRTASCSGTNRTVALNWGASSDAHLVGYRVYRSTDGLSWAIVSSTTGLAASDTTAKSLTSVRYRIAAYDRAGNESTAGNTITLSKNQCS